MTRALVLLAAVSLLSIASAAAQEPTRELAGAATCRADEPVELGTSTVRELRPELAFGPEGRGLAMWPSGQHMVQVRALGPDGPGPLVSAELDRATDLAALEPVGSAFVAVATAPRLRGRGAPRLRMRAFAADGTPLGPALEPAPADAWSALTARLPLPDALALAWTATGSAGIDVVRVAEDGSIARERHPLGAEWGADVPVVGLAIDDGRVVALGSVASGEPSSFLLALGTHPRPIAALPAGARVVRFTSESGVATVVYRVEGRRPRLSRFAVSDGRLVEGPLPLPSTAALPLDAADVVVPELAEERDRTVLRRTDLSGTAIGEPVDIAETRGRVVARLAWDGRRFVALWATRSGRTWSVRMRAISCSAP